ncbi:PTS glucose transporter subunit IIA [Candidatus Epulonipiscium fishelsonii]|uniref:PTS glucose transporter subunit IIA n=1 Tax=Candidatus Epulonipiscium fishelsonii TaxID=77094 RepID=A0ACC8XF85_9FIRM|nr:PTS glucose transporter subunit IIA [Epulopiscium sp. SCG-B05WGA-EpuloA1]ONI42110.1 PTS glucose transporter subunit IIA [Epulopiscium sp. SCG-B11WGA-EpuloA1]
MFKMFKAKKDILASPVSGTAIPLKDVDDVTFASEMLGKGIAVVPSENKVVSPCDGEVALIFETGHAVSVVSKEGAEILIHIGINTVNLSGKYFTKLVTEGQSVKKGEALIEFDREAIKAEGYDITTMVIICNSSEYKEINALKKGDVNNNTELLSLVKK